VETRTSGSPLRRWRDGNSCTTSVLRPFLAGAYTDVDSPFQTRRGLTCVFGDLNWLCRPGRVSV
jgi:hypothetical protein